MKKLLLLAAAGIGYVLGARAGRERYDQIVGTVNKVKNDPRVQEKAQQAMKPLLGLPAELSVLDIMCFGPAAKPPYKRWKKSLSDISNWNGFDASHFMTDAQIDEWVTTTRHKVMYRDAQNVD